MRCCTCSVWGCSALLPLLRLLMVFPPRAVLALWEGLRPKSSASSSVGREKESEPDPESMVFCELGASKARRWRAGDDSMLPSDAGAYSPVMALRSSSHTGIAVLPTVCYKMGGGGGGGGGNGGGGGGGRGGLVIGATSWSL